MLCGRPARTRMTTKHLPMALCHINVSVAAPIDAATLLACLKAPAPDPLWRGHLRVFLEETSTEVLHGIVLEGHIDFPTLAAAVDVWGCDNDETRTWIRDMARRSEEHTSELQSLMRISY